jgi:hypothetical protein
MKHANWPAQRPVDKLVGGRAEAIVNGRCIPKPIGCGNNNVVLRDDLSAKEYLISGLCQDCQDALFGTGEE